MINSRLFVSLILFLEMACCTVAVAQETDGGRHWTPAENSADLYEIKYDEDANQYLFYPKSPSSRRAPVKIMNRDEYRKYQSDNALRNAWLGRRNAETQTGQGGEKDNISRLIPPLKILPSSSLASTILGGNEMKINLQGNIELLFGYKWSRTDNPTIPLEYRSHGIFDFKINYQLNASGQIGNRIKLDFVSGSESNLSFQDRFKISYMAQGFGLTPDIGGEDEIIQKIEAGNVSMPLSGSLITGSQTLFGLRTDLKFGKVLVETVISQQKGENNTINVQGGAQSTPFDITADKYDANKHFFLSEYFRNNYNNALKYLPLIQSGITIKRIEVWITNKNSRFESSRNIVALDAIGGENPPNSKNNPLYNTLRNDPRIRSMSTINAILADNSLQQGRDFEKVENARRLNASEFSFNAQLGYISLNMALNNDEVLAVAYEYTAGGHTYRVGEFYDDILAPDALILKLIKGTNLSPRYNTWKLMMKNVYNLGTYQLSKDDFTLNIMRKDDELGTYVPYLTEGNIKNVPLITALNLDNSNAGGSRFPDGKFDFVEGITVQSSTGSIIFPMLEPFGRDLEAAIGDPAIAAKYVYKELYDSTLVRARQFSYKNKFNLTGRYKASSNAEIILGAFDIPEGSVVVTAGGIKLVENVDYTVNYAMGRVQIINPVYMGNNVPLKVSVENMSMFSMVNKTLLGANVKYGVNKNLRLGGTIIHLSERPLTQKVAFGEEPISNTIWGLNGTYQHDVPFLTKWVDAMPLIKTKAASKINLEGEFAHFMPGHHSAIGGKGASYIDDFEAAQLTIDLKQHTNWALGSTPKYVSSSSGDYFTGNSDDSISNGFQRSHIAWYNIDPLFLRNSSSTPAHIKNNSKLQKNHYVREIDEKEIFPNKQNSVGSNTTIPVFNVAYYPNERGAYNYTTDLNNDGSVPAPKKNFGAISRALPVTDFESANIEFITFWLLDPFIYNRDNGGKLFFNLGDVSEDLLRDGRKSFENGIPYPDNPDMMEETPFGRVPKVQSITNTFDNNPEARELQDVGLDCLNDEGERTFFEKRYKYLTTLKNNTLLTEAYNKFEADPSNDNYHHYLGDDYDREGLSISERYKRYNMHEDNSRIATGGMVNSATTMPNTEDLNKDNTINELESYYEYMIELSPANMQVGSNYITDIRRVNKDDPDYGSHQEVNWYQFKIPVRAGKAHNNIEDFKSIKFMRMFLTGFSEDVILRFAKFELTRGDWRKYEFSLVETQEGTSMPETTSGTLDVSAVSIEENAGRQPVNYLLPPGVSRIIDNTSNQQYQRNEQSMMLTVKNLASGDARAVYKIMNYDMRTFRRLQMHIHAEAIYENTMGDNDVSLFVRVGSDYQYNYYEYEIPLKVTPHGNYTNKQNNIVWPSENYMDIELSKFIDIKNERNRVMKDNTGISYRTSYEKADGKNTIRIVGNPNMGEVRAMMIGVRNPSGKNGNRLAYTNTPRNAIIWVNELRLSDFDEGGGWAATGRITTNLADFGTVSLASNIMTAGFGGIDTRVSNQRQEQSFSYDLNTQCELGKFFSDSMGVSIPFGFAYAETFITPKYSPLNPDILYEDAIRDATAQERSQLEALSVNYSKRRNFTLNNIRILGTKSAQKLGPVAPGNFTAGYMYSESLKHDISTERDYNEEHKLSGGYGFTVKPYSFAPFKKSKIKTEWFKIIREFNLNLYPGTYGFTTTYSDAYNEYITRSFYEGMAVNPIIWRERTNSRNYTLGWDITNSIKFNLNAVNNSRQDISMGRSADTLQQDTRWRNTHYGHDYSLSYNLPINKLPIFSWTTASVSYRATYDWDAAPITLGTDMPNPGNAIRNSNNFQSNLTFNFLQLYNKSSFLKEIYQEADGRSKPKQRKTIDVSYTKEKVNFTKNRKVTVKHGMKNATNIKAQVLNAEGGAVASTIREIDPQTLELQVGEDLRQARVVVTGKAPVPPSPFSYLGKFTLRTVMMVKTANLTYTRGGATSLSGYNPQTTIMGLDAANDYSAPGIPFILGSQSRNWQGNFYGDAVEYMLTDARRNGWLTGDTALTLNPFTMNTNTSLAMKVSLEPIRDLRIELNASQNHNYSRSWYDAASGGGVAPTEEGSFTTSTISIGTAFENASSDNYYESSSYSRFKEVRKEIAHNIASQRLGSGYSIDSAGYPTGYSHLAQDVLIPAFSASYMGNSVERSMNNYTKFLSQLPLPNWNITYSGLTNIKAVKEYLKSASLTHSYKSTYSIGSFATNSEDGGTNDYGDFYSKYSVSNVSLTENIVLGGIDLTWAVGLQTRFELRKNRRVELNLSNNQIVENNSWESTIGGGYTVSVPQIFSFEKKLDRPNLTVRADFTLRDDKTLIRKLAEGTTQITEGKRNIAIKFTADYLLLKDLTFRLYYDWMKNNPYVSAMNTLNWSGGFTLRYTLGM